MTKQIALEHYGFGAGYFNTNVLEYPKDALADGSKNLFVLGADALRVFRGIKDTTNNAGRTMFTLPSGWGALEDNGATDGIGSIFTYVSESLFWIGGGKVNHNGTVLNDSVAVSDFLATANLQLSPQVTGGSPDPTYERFYTAGLAQPDAPTVAVKDATGGLTGLMTGVYSFKIARVRSETGGRSIASVTSASIQLTGQTVRMTFPALDSNGQDKWAIFGTRAGFGGIGVHWLYAEIDDTDLSTIDSVPRSYNFEYNDSELLPIKAYIDDYPPPSGSFGCRLDNYVAVIGAFTNAIAISIRNFPESFNPDHLSFLPEAPTAVLPVQQGNYVYVATATSVHALSVAPSAYDNPQILQTVWSETGIAHPHSWCSYEGVVFAFVSRQGAVTMDVLGSPNSDFALPVAKEMDDWEVADTKVFASPEHKGVLFTNNGKALLFNVQNRKWSTPAYVDDFDADEIVSGLVINQRLQIALYDTGSSTYNLFEFDEKPVAGSTNYIAKSPDIEINPTGRANINGVKATYRASEAGTTNVKLFTDYSLSASKTLASTDAGAGVQTTLKSRWYQPRKEACAVSIEGTQSDFTKDCHPSRVTLYGTVEDSNEID